MCNPVSQPVSTAQVSLSDAVSVRMLRAALDAQEQQGSEIVEMIEDAAALSVPAHHGRLDVYA
jgi:hypothetical protein